MTYRKEFSSLIYFIYLMIFGGLAIDARVLPNTTTPYNSNFLNNNLTEATTLTNVSYKKAFEVLSCNFDLGVLCPGLHHVVSKDLKWRIRKGKTPSTLTGPIADHTQGNEHGSYVYTESSKPRLNGQTARFQTDPLGGGGYRCITFYYLMYGHTMGELTVRILDDNGERIEMSLKKRSSQQKQWKIAHFGIDTSNTRNYQVIFQSELSYGIFGDIAIDDMKITVDDCAFYPSSGRYRIPRPTPRPPPLPKDTTCGRQSHVKNIQVTTTSLNDVSAGRIIGGSDSKHGQWPWMAMLLVKHGNTHRLLCGGTLLGVEWIVTAAHCVDEITKREDIKVRLGVIKAFNSSLNSTTDYDIADVYIHNKFRTKFKFNYDIALIKLKQPIIPTKHVLPICLTDNNVRPSRTCYVAGWGYIKNRKLINSVKYDHTTRTKNKKQSFFPKSLKHGKILIRLRQDCLQNHGSRLSDNMFCAGYDVGVPDTCLFDSGGPLMCEEDGQWSLTGITSWGQGCGQKDKYGVYTHVDNVKNWILSVMYQPQKYTTLHYQPGE